MQSQSPFCHLLETNYAADPAEVSVIEGWIRNYDEIADELGDELAELERRCKEVKERRNIHLELATKHRGLISPARRLPSDILSTIFSVLLFLAGPEASPPPAVTISHVCRQWRDLALDNPLLWTNILMPIPMYPVPISQEWGIPPSMAFVSDRDLELHQVSTSHWKQRVLSIVERMNIFAARSGECPLQLSFSACDGEHGAQLFAEMQEHDAFYTAGFSTTVLEAIEQIRKRVEKFHIRLRINKAASFLFVWMMLPERSVKGLRCLEYDIEYHGTSGGMNMEQIWDEEFGGAVNLRKAPLSCLTLRMPDTDMRRIKAPWDSLTDLTVRFQERGRHARHVLRVLKKTPNIERLAIEFCNPLSLDPTAETPLHLRKLQRLTVRGGSLPAQFASSLLLPSLKELDVLHHPHAGGPKRDTPLAEWVGRHGDQLTHLSFDCTVFTSATLSWIIERLRNVVSLELLGAPKETVGEFLPFSPEHLRPPSPPEIGHELLMKMAPPSNRAPADEQKECFCPKLERLILSLAEDHGEGIKEDILNLIEERRKVPRKGSHPVSWLRKVDVNLDVGPVEPLMEELRRRGVDTDDVKITARHPDERSKPHPQTIEVHGLGAVLLP